MSSPRFLVVAEGEVGAYHCMARCVRRARLCGEDPLTGRNFDHRKDWLRHRLQEIAGVFACEIGGYAILSNHLHVVLKTRPDLADLWSPAEVTSRWRTLHPIKKKPRDVVKAMLEAEAADKKIVATRRARLSSVSWFMRCLLEPTARRANAEDRCTGRFWEERFKCVGLLDESAIITCTAYVDLNPVRAGIAATPELSEYTSVFDRIQQRQDPRPESVATDNWLSPLLQKDRKERKGTPRWRLSHSPWLDLPLDDYLELLDWTGRQLREDKRGAIPAKLAPILQRLQIRETGWLLATKNFGKLFRRYAGAAAQLTARAKSQNRKAAHGVTAAKEVFG